MLTYVKRPAEEFTVAVEWATKLPSGATLSSGTLVAVDRMTGSDVSATVLASTTATISGTQASLKGKVGTSPTDYLITMTVTLSTGDKLIEEILMQVRLAMTVVATASATNANSYCTRAEADEYHKVHLYNSAWIGADDWKREAALIWATRLLDEQVDWKGYPTTNTQALRWPRSWVEDRDGQIWIDNASIPAWLKHATAELARHLLASDRTAERSIGIQSVTTDTVEVVFDKHDVPPVLPPSVRAIVEPYGTVNGPGSGTAKLVRT